MRHIVKSKESNELNIDIMFPERYYDPESMITELHMVTGDKTSTGELHVQYFENISVTHSKVSTKEVMPLHMQFDFNMVVLEFVLSVNELKIQDLTSGSSIYYTSVHQNMVFIPGLPMSHEQQPADDIEMLIVQLDPEYVKKLIPEATLFDNWRKNIEGDKVARLFAENAPITPEMHLVLKDIINNDRKGAYKRLLLEAKVLELIRLQLEQYEQLTREGSSSLRQKDRDQMQEVRDIIENNIQSPCSLIDLAHMVGTNEFNLKKKFKEVYGTTVFGYLNRLRMEEARSMLLRGELSIGQISDIVGYKNSNHFSTAFKKYFGINPSELKK
ncbi:MAG: AraC family transcriptional regulator [Cytophagaceae bacterium]